MIQQMSCQALVRVWHCECEFTPDGEYHVHLWEPLDVDAPADARPYCYGVGQIDFYSRDGNTPTHKHVWHHNLNGGKDVVLLKNGIFYEVCSGQCVYRNGHWMFRWWAGSNTRRARMLNAGWPEYQRWEL